MLQKQKKRGIIKHRQFKTECVCTVIINNKLVICNNLREIKKKIYTQGIRGQKYVIDICDKSTGIINDTYLMKYTNEGPIFTLMLVAMDAKEKMNKENKEK